MTDQTFSPLSEDERYVAFVHKGQLVRMRSADNNSPLQQNNGDCRGEYR